MLPIHCILHPTDFSEHSDYALRLACALARDYSARLVVLHVAVPPIVAYGEGALPPDPETYLDEARAQLESLNIPDAGIRVERRFLEGDPADVILWEINDAHADLVVMGTHGRTWIRRLLMGSVAESVVRRAECPVLTLKRPYPVSEPLRQEAEELVAVPA